MIENQDVSELLDYMEAEGMLPEYSTYDGLPSEDYQEYARELTPTVIKDLESM